jgi:gas vesicle protein
MRLLIAFLLGLIVGGVAMLYLPNSQRDDMSKQLKQQTSALESEMKSLGEQMKNLSLSKGEQNQPSSPTPPPSPTPPSPPSQP